MQREVFNYLTLRGFFCNAQHPLTFLIHVKNPSSKYCNSVEHQIYFWGAQKGLLLRYSNVAGVFNGRKSTFLLLSYRTVLWLQLSGYHLNYNVNSPHIYAEVVTFEAV